ncbi:MAG: RNA polymerase sigma factor [Vulcanimicrobiaceae bacterium]
MGRWVPPEAIASALSGNEAAVDDLIAGIWPACFRLAMMVTGDRGLAEDAAQETCVTVYRKIRSLRRVDAFDAWLYRIIMRESTRVRRRSSNVAEPTDHIAPADSSIGLDVWQALGELAPELRQVTVLFYFHDLTGEEIAAALRVSHGAVRMRLSRARDRVRTLLGDYDIELRTGYKEMNYAV